VAFSWSGGEGERTSVHAQVWGGGHRYEASASEWKALAALDRARDKLETEIRRGHSKEIDERHGRGH
jgi:ribosome-associated translation inhibitor RaiA